MKKIVLIGEIRMYRHSPTKLLCQHGDHVWVQGAGWAPETALVSTWEECPLSNEEDYRRAEINMMH